MESKFFMSFLNAVNNVVKAFKIFWRELQRNVEKNFLSSSFFHVIYELRMWVFLHSKLLLN